ncbi:pseudouridine-5-phosphate glycosidase [Halobacillus halophilus]|uniref:pseudouridine-5'-phosphate glycosidase n=1 Tax=Halobacillus halophilus TaxID=1570 RepID=UPI00136B52BC|nr:pseudouridine-5'-phosphate glycosidase [Halobacillus halophilus]MYL28794.1 pseudouridine-5-phosphate glycosidase [Halobacillus halophilus]
MNPFVDMTEEVAYALAENLPVVALESTIISHGMPYPDNLRTAEEVAAIIREHGAVPATTAIMDGKIKIGLTKEELTRLASEKEVIKASRKDIAYLAASGKTGATTVAGTMFCAGLAGIPIFVTGGIGGVHRGAESTMDISADLEELGRTNVAVICAGAKSILDLGLTMEYLETKGVPVLSYQTDHLPAFFTRSSAFSSNYKVNDPEEIAAVIDTKWSLGLDGGLVIANPIPEHSALEEAYMNQTIEEALQEADKQKVKQKEVTPFLLEYIHKATEGKSLQANIALIKSNAVLGAQTAAAFQKLRNSVHSL